MIIADDEFVKISGTLLPGILKNIEILGSALVEEIEVEGKGKKPKQATGYEDAKITLDLLLLDDLASENDQPKTKYEKLAIIQSLFKQHGQKKPKIYEIINEHTSIRNIGQVVFKELTSKETNKKCELAVSLVFWEHEEIKITTKKAGSSSKQSNVSPEYQEYLDNDRGKAPRIKDKTSSTPAQELM